MIRIVIGDDHRMVREGFRRILERHPDMRVVGEAGDGAELLQLLGSVDAHVLILDISMPGPGFLEVMESVRQSSPAPGTLVVSMHAEERWAIRALRAGAAGYLTKDHSEEELAEAVRRVHAGGRYVTPSLAEALARRLGGEGGGPPHEALSDREFQVMELLGGGLSVKAAARELGLSPKTVSTYRARILAKLGLHSTAQLIRYVAEQGLL